MNRYYSFLKVEALGFRLDGMVKKTGTAGSNLNPRPKPWIHSSRPYWPPARQETAANLESELELELLRSHLYACEVLLCFP